MFFPVSSCQYLQAISPPSSIHFALAITSSMHTHQWQTSVAWSLLLGVKQKRDTTSRSFTYFVNVLSLTPTKSSSIFEMRLHPRFCTPPSLISFAKYLHNNPLLLPSASSSSSDISETAFDSGNEAHETPSPACEPDNLEYSSVVPSNSKKSLELPDWHEPRYADHPPIGFDEAEWPRVWSGHQREMDQFLVYGLNLWGGYPTPWFQEYEFMGVQWRLLVDHHLAHDRIPIFTQGMVLLFQNCNNQKYRYIIDHCAHRDETKAYLKVICFNSKRQFCASWSLYPPIILVVPINRCNVRMHPNVFTSSPEIQVRHTGLSHILCSFKWQEPQDKSDKRGMNVQAAWRRLTFWRQWTSLIVRITIYPHTYHKSTLASYDYLA